MIPREQIEEILEKNDIVDVISEYVELKRRGSSFLGRCPFHNEKTPSFSVNREKNIFHCFGCHEHGDVISFIMKHENVSYVEALKILADRVGMEITDDERKYDDSRKILREINRQAGIFFYKTLRTNEGKPAYDYLKKRGLTNDIINRFGIGYAPRGGSRLYKILKGMKYNDDIILKSGLFINAKGKILDKFYDRVMFPIFDSNGKVVAFGGRILNGEGAKYLNSPETTIFHKKRIIYGIHIAKKLHPKFLILCEGYMDVISMHQAGFAMSVATMGTAFNQTHAIELKKYVENIFMLYDSDEAGQAATEKAAKILIDNGLSVKVIDISPYKDPDECLQKKGREFLLERIKEAKPEIYFRIDREKNRYDLYDPISKMKFIQRVGEIISDYSDDYIKVALSDIARKYLIDENLLNDYINRSKTGQEIKIKKQEEVLEKRHKEKVNKNKLEKTILWILCRDNLYENAIKYLDVSYFADEECKIIFNKINYERKNDRPVNQRTIYTWFEDPSLRDLVGDIFIFNDNELNLSEKNFSDFVIQSIIRFIEDYYDRRRNEETDFGKITELIKEQNEKLSNLRLEVF